MQSAQDNDGSTLSLTTLIDAQHLAVNSPRAERKGYGPWVGPFRGIRRGQGLDFDDLRPYAEGDDVRHIDWKVTARYNAPHTRLYREEKDNVVTLVVDFSHTMYTGSTELRAVQAGKLAAALLWKSIQSGSRCGLQIIDDSGVQGIAATAGERGAIAGCQFLAERFELAKALASQTNDDQTHINRLANMLAKKRRLFGNVVIVSGFDQTTDELSKQLNLLGGVSRASQQLYAVHIIDKMEATGIPPGFYTYNSNKLNNRVRLSQKQSAKLNAVLQQQQQAVKQTISDANIAFVSTKDGVQRCVTDVLSLGWVA